MVIMDLIWIKANQHEIQHEILPFCELSMFVGPCMWIIANNISSVESREYQNHLSPLLFVCMRPAKLNVIIYLNTVHGIYCGQISCILWQEVIVTGPIIS
jgi:hypothetical protein